MDSRREIPVEPTNAQEAPFWEATVQRPAIRKLTARF